MKTNEDYYKDALSKIVHIHEDRAKKYGDTWDELGQEGIFWMITSKYLRFKHNHNTKDKNLYDSAIDTLSDIINYCLFYMAILMKKRDEEE